MKEKPYIVSNVLINNEELMIMIDLNGYDRNEIRFCDELKDYDL